jgi:hypothetical protein
MPLKQQLQEAFYIANGKRLAAKNVELARKVQSKDTVSKDSASTHRDGESGTAPRLSADLAASLKRAGFKYDPETKFYKKTLPNGKSAFRDPSTHRTWVQ